jgi:hypothetical protein
VLDGTQGRHAGREALRAAVGPVWAAEGPATLHLTLNPVIEPGPSDDQATVRSVLLIVDPATRHPPSALPQQSPRNSAGPGTPGASPAAPSRPPDRADGNVVRGQSQLAAWVRALLADDDPHPGWPSAKPLG